MGEKIIKKEIVDGKEVEVAYERNVFGDRRIGELHRNLDGSAETRPGFFDVLGSEPTVRIEKEKFLQEKRRGSVGDQEGTFDKEKFMGVDMEEDPTFKEKSSKPTDIREPKDERDYNIHGGTFSEEKEDKSQDQTPFQEFLGYIFEGMGLKKLSQFFYSHAARVYETRKNFYLAGRMNLKAGEKGNATDNFILDIVHGKEPLELRDILLGENIGNEVLEGLEERCKRKEAGDIATFLDLRERAADNYFIASRSSDIDSAFHLLERTAHYLEEINPKKAAKFYREAARFTSVGHPKINERLRSENALTRAEELEEMLDSDPTQKS